jgi:hypothetical protein
MIMVNSAAARQGRRHLVAVVVTVAKGYDLDYIWKTQGQSRAERTSGGYYIDAAQAGEPPGRWWGPGAETLGFGAGQIVERKPYDAVYQQIDPHTGSKLGRPRGRYAKFADHLARLKAAEPQATAERLIELEREAAQATRQPAAYTDVTISFSKSISVLHASIRENARRARLAGDQQAAAYWAGREETFQEVLHRANRSALEYLQTWAGITRTGYHGIRVDGQEPGRFEEAGLSSLPGCKAPAGTVTPKTTFTTRSPGSPGPPATESGGRMTRRACARSSARCRRWRPPRWSVN